MDFEFAYLQNRRNARGMLGDRYTIVLNIGFDLGFIPPKVFTLLVIRATVMTGPALRVLLPRTGHAIPEGVEA
jgi:hypothetical protein